MSTSGRHVRNRHTHHQLTRSTHGTGGYDATVFDATDSAYGNILDYGGIGQVEMPGQIPGGNLLDGTVDGGLKIIPGSIDITPFASDIRPVILWTGVLPVLPNTDYPIGQFIYKTDDVPPRLYKNVANAWVAAIGPNDIQADSITAGQIAAGAISASELAAGAVTVGKLGDGAGSNFAPNPSFEMLNGETVNTYGEPIFGWDTNPATGAQGFAGSASARFANASAKFGDNTVQLRHDASTASRKEVESVVIPIQGGRRFGLRVWARGLGGNNAATTVSIGLRGVTSTGARVEASPLSTLVVGSSSTWQRLSLVDTGTILGFAPTSAVSTHLTIRLCLEPGGSVGDSINFDGVEVYYLDDDVTHASGNVQITDTGITINNGKLTFRDAAGTLAMDGAGFGGTWQRFLATGFFNGDFFAPATTLATQLHDTTNPLPWWSYARASGTACTIQCQADAAAASGNRLAFILASGAASDEAYVQQFVPISGSRGQSFQYHLAMTVNPTAYTANNAQLYVSLQHYKKDGTTTTGSLQTFTARVGDLAPGTMVDVGSWGATMTAPPADAYYTRVRFGLKRNTAANSETANVEVYEVRLTRMPQVVGIAPSNGTGAPAVIDKDFTGNGLWIMPNGSAIGALNLQSNGTAAASYVSTQNANLIADRFFRNGGTSFPTSPATNDQYFRTDHGLWFYYDGTRWLSTQLYESIPDAIARGAAASLTVAYFGFPAWWTTGIWIEDHAASFLIASGGTGLSGSHSWIGGVRPRNTSNVDGTVAVTMTVNSGSSGVWRQQGAQAINALLGSNAVYVTTWTKTGTPGTLTALERITYRLVAT